jgi:hypothetical protein
MGGSEVFVGEGGGSVFVGRIGVLDGTGVSVGDSGVFVGGTGVFVGAGVEVGSPGADVSVGCGVLVDPPPELLVRVGVGEVKNGE